MLAYGGASQRRRLTLSAGSRDRQSPLAVATLVGGEWVRE
jgi:hypothetical protein